MGEVTDIGTSSCDWSWEENKSFELALAAVDENSPDRWKEIAFILGESKSAEEVEAHYNVLVEDLESIESGRLDHDLVESIEHEDRIQLGGRRRKKIRLDAASWSRTFPGSIKTRVGGSRK